MQPPSSCRLVCAAACALAGNPHRNIGQVTGTTFLQLLVIATGCTNRPRLIIRCAHFYVAENNDHSVAVTADD